MRDGRARRRDRLSRFTLRPVYRSLHRSWLRPRNSWQQNEYTEKEERSEPSSRCNAMHGACVPSPGESGQAALLCQTKSKPQRQAAITAQRGSLCSATGRGFCWMRCSNITDRTVPLREASCHPAQEPAKPTQPDARAAGHGVRLELSRSGRSSALKSARPTFFTIRRKFWPITGCTIHQRRSRRGDALARRAG